MTDWRDIVLEIQNLAAMFHAEAGSRAPGARPPAETILSVAPAIAYTPPDISAFTSPIMNRSWGYRSDSTGDSVYGQEGVRMLNNFVSPSRSPVSKRNSCRQVHLGQAKNPVDQQEFERQRNW